MWENVPAGILLIDPDGNKILSANPEALRITGFSESDVIGQTCNKLICPKETGKCPIKDLGLTIDHSERSALSKEGNEIPILKTVTKMQTEDREYFVESFIDISRIKEAEETLLAYLREATLRVRNPVNLVKNNLGDLVNDLNEGNKPPSYFIAALSVQEKNMEEILNNLKEIEQAVAEKRTEIPEDLRNYLKRE